MIRNCVAGVSFGEKSEPTYPLLPHFVFRHEALSKKEIVFARTTPYHKLEIVTRFQVRTLEGTAMIPYIPRTSISVPFI